MQDKEVFFCRFKYGENNELKVIVTAQCLSEFRKDFNCHDLEKICRYAAEDALSRGISGKIEIVGKTYLAVRKRLKDTRARVN